MTFSKLYKIRLVLGVLRRDTFDSLRAGILKIKFSRYLYTNNTVTYSASIYFNYCIMEKGGHRVLRHEEDAHNDRCMFDPRAVSGFPDSRSSARKMRLGLIRQIPMRTVR